MTIVGWASLGMLLYVYLGYPLLLWAIARVRGPRPVRQGPDHPTVSVVISAYNEATVIRQKLENTLALDYPADRLEVVVVSDGSDDGTDDIVAEHVPRVRLERRPERSGKTAGLNAVVPTLTGEIVVFTDANAMYLPDALRALVRNFADPRVGCVTGESRYVDSDRTGAAASESAYWSYDTRLKALETAIGSMVGGDGAIYAIRRRLWRAIPETAISDFLNPLQIVSAGWRAVYEPAAVCLEAPAGSLRKEYHRRVRIVSRSWRAIFQAPAVLNPFVVGFFAVSVLSHKVLRWFSGLFVLLGVLAGPSVLRFVGVPEGLGATEAVVAGSVAAVLLGLVVARWPRVFAFAAFLVAIQTASLVGIGRGSLGRVSATWTTPRDEGAAVHPAASETGRIVLLVLCALGAVVAWSWGVGGDRSGAFSLFWVSAGVLGYVYAGYPLAVAALSAVWRRPVVEGDVAPVVCLFVTANDEAAVIGAKLENALALDYPPDRLRIVVASDGSRDGTNEIVRSFADRGVRLIASTARHGKMATINDGVPRLGDEIEVIVFTDANAFLERDALRRVVSCLADARVGAVSGCVALVGRRAELGPPEDLYWRYESRLQAAESAVGSMVSVDGAFYAIRRRLFVPPPDDTILDDVSIPMAVVKQGHRVVLATSAIAWEPGSSSAREELLRKSRVIAGAVQFLSRPSQIPWRSGQVVFSLLSHKILRWFSPVFIAVACLASLRLSAETPVFLVCPVTLLLLVAAGAAGCIPWARRATPIALAHYFCLVQMAAALGILRGLFGLQPAAWRRFPREPMRSTG